MKVLMEEKAIVIGHFGITDVSYEFCPIDNKGSLRGTLVNLDTNGSQRVEINNDFYNVLRKELSKNCMNTVDVLNYKVFLAAVLTINN